MIALLVERRVRSVFAALSRGAWQEVLPGLAPDVHHRFAGDHALGGERHDREAVAAWFRRLYRLFPSLVFDVRAVSVGGRPWDLTATVEWDVVVTTALGASYPNTGAHVLRIRYGRVVCLHAYEDSLAVARALDVLQAAGIDEAGALPITSG